MPPRLSNTLRLTHSLSRPSTELPRFLIPFLHTQHRPASILSSLADNPSAYSKKIRRGRGPSSGKGKTSGRGHKGQKQHGKVPRGFNGGQTKDEIVHGKRGDHGFANFSLDIQPLNLYKLQEWIDQGRIDASRPITIKELRESRCVTNIKDGVKLLAQGSETLTSPLHVIISRASAKAIASIEAAGGSVTTRYYTPFAIRRIVQGKMDPIHSLQSKFSEAEIGGGGVQEQKRGFYNRLPDPTSRKDIEYYRDPAHRGYLSHLVPEGHGPSLFYKTPGTGKMVEKKVRKAKSVAAEDRIW